MKNKELKKIIYKIGIDKNRLAFIDLFDYFAPRIIGYLIGTGSTKEIAEEITQDALSLVWQKASLFDQNKGNVSTWIFTIARNKRIDIIRKNEIPSYNTSDLIDALYQQNDHKNQNLEENINEMKSKLNENDRNLIKMSFFEGKTHKNISKDLEIPLGTVKSRIRNILLKMRKL